MKILKMQFYLFFFLFELLNITFHFDRNLVKKIIFFKEKNIANGILVFLNLIYQNEKIKRTLSDF